LVSWEEFKAFVMPLGIEGDGAKFAFEMIDDNSDGVLSKEELSTVSMAIALCRCIFFVRSTLIHDSPSILSASTGLCTLLF
jgi:hypothetical protein